jgi:hypothetical protein
MNVRKLELCLAEIVRRLRGEAEARVAPLENRLDNLERAFQTERRLVALEQRAGMPDDSVKKFYRGDSMSAAEYLALCERLRPPLVYGAWRPDHASWNGGGHAGRHPQ